MIVAELVIDDSRGGREEGLLAQRELCSPWSLLTKVQESTFTDRGKDTQSGSQQNM